MMWLVTALLVSLAPLLALRGNYGYVLFMTLPLSVGLIGSLLFSLKQKRKFGNLFALSLIPLGVLLLGFLVIAREGFICVLMALPLTFVPLTIGVAMGYAIQDHYWSKFVGILIVFVLNTGAYVGDRQINKFDVVQVHDEMIIDASPSKVWVQLSQPFEFGDADNFFLANGVSFPQSMELQSSNNCNSLYCVYNNGIITASVDNLIPERLLYFSFHEPPVSMKETSLYADVEPDHIRGRILIDYGSFTLEETSDGKTRLVATTQFRSNIGPQFYWRWWSSYLMHQTHEHVLEKIKASAEN